jgi:molybdate transport system substrate-binding protein
MQSVFPSRSRRSTWRSRVSLLLVLTVLLSLFVQCSADATATPDAGSSTEVKETPEATVEVEERELVVFAAASLTESFTQMAEEFEAQNKGVSVVLNLAGSQQLALQLEEGAQADVFASANPNKMEQVVTAGRIDADAPQTFTGNRLVIVAPADNPAGMETFNDLAAPGLQLVLAAEEVPVGNYSRQMLDNALEDPNYGEDFKQAVLDNVISNEETVKLVVSKVQLGEADAGIVYGSDVTPSVADALMQIEIPDEFNVKASYPIAVLGDAAQPDLAAEFISFVLDKEGQAIMAHWGFTP